MTRTGPTVRELQLLRLLRDRFSANCREKIALALETDAGTIHWQALLAAWEVARYANLLTRRSAEFQRIYNEGEE